jgi:uncharacterized membrane protein
MAAGPPFSLSTLAIALHALAAVIWVGGMFFAYLVLRPSAGVLAGPDRLKLWHGVFSRFFPWVWAAVAVLLTTGYWMLFAYLGGFAGAGPYVNVMHLTGWVMVLLFLHLFFSPWRRFRAALAAGNTAEAGQQLDQIRLLVLINLVLGLITVIAGASGSWLG